jgi:hypothetical protein
VVSNVPTVIRHVECSTLQVLEEDDQPLPGKRVRVTHRLPASLFCREPPTMRLQQIAHKKSSRHVRMTGSLPRIQPAPTNSLFFPHLRHPGSRLGSRRSPAIGHGHLRAVIPQLPPCSRYSRENPRTAWACFTFKDDLVRIQTCFRSCSEEDC